MAYFDNISTTFPYIERAVLMEDIKLPILNNKKKLKRGFFYNLRRLVFKYELVGSGDDIRLEEKELENTYYDNYSSDMIDAEYKLAYNEIKNIDAKFFIPVLMPTINNNGTEIKVNNRAPKTTGFVNSINSLSYESSNCVTLTIPKYMIFQFLDLKNETKGVKDPIIPKGTEFLVASVGADICLDQFRIIGLYTLTYDKKHFPNLTDDYYGGNPVK